MDSTGGNQEYFDSISDEYASYYESPESILDYEKQSRLETALDLVKEQPTCVLNIGVGAGELFVATPDDWVTHPIGLDFSRSMIQASRDRAPEPIYLQGSVTHLPIADETTDLVFCLGVLGYLDRDEIDQVMRELSRVLQTDGQLLLSFANQRSVFRTLRQWYFQYYVKTKNAIRGRETPEIGYETYRPDEVLGHLNDAGLSVDERRYLTYSTGIKNTRINLALYRYFESRFETNHLLGPQAMTWVVSARKT